MATRRSKIKAALSKSISSFIQGAQKEKHAAGSQCEEGESVRPETDENGTHTQPTPNLKADGCSEQEFMSSSTVETEVVTQQETVMYNDDQLEIKAEAKLIKSEYQVEAPEESHEIQKSRPLLRRKIKPKIPSSVLNRTSAEAKPTSQSTVQDYDKEAIIQEQVLTVTESIGNGCVEENVDVMPVSCASQESTQEKYEQKYRPALRRKIKPNIRSNVVNNTTLVVAEPREDANDNFEDNGLNTTNSTILEKSMFNEDFGQVEQDVQNEDQDINGSAIPVESAEVKPISKSNGLSFRRRVMKPNLVARPLKSEAESETSSELAFHKIDAIKMETISSDNIANPDDSQVEDGAGKLTTKTPIASPFRRRSMTPNIRRKSSKSEDESTNEASKIQSRVPIKPNSKIIVLNHEILEFAKYQKPGQSCEESKSDITLTTPVGQFGSPSYVSSASKQPPTSTDESRKSDSEYSAPLSPTKPSRPRMRPNPLGVAQRYRHTSASESEDESRKSYRQRNDSVCSATSTTQDAASISDCFSPQKPKEYNSVIQRKCRRSEQSRKLAEAKHDFALKFGSNKPDRKKLTMIDLIFYNPTTNLMASALKKKEEETAANENADEPTEAQQEEEEEPDEQSKSGSDEENEMPAPQLKIGSDGQLVIDERSLKVESKSMKKDREKLEKAKIIDDRLERRGMYKRAKRSKDWNKQETLKFYRALNTIGTDFTLMCELFPRRTRRELKMKFKKEERMNLNLVNRAIMEPCGFDFNLIKHEADMEEKELVEVEKQKQRELDQKKEASKKRKLTNLCSKPNSNSPKIPKMESHKPQAERKKSKNLDIMDVLDSDDSDDAAMMMVDGDSDIDMAEESILQGMTKPTRSGRVPKIRDRYVAPPIRNQAVQPRTQERPPGSLTVMTTTGPDGQPVYKVFMNNNKGLENLFSISAEISSAVNGEATRNGEAQVVDDNNVTIPADVNVTIPADVNVTIPADVNVTIPADVNVTIPAEVNLTIPAE